MKIKQFARLTNIEVSEKTKLITAGNGEGKSSIVNAYCWLFTGKYNDGSTPDVEIYHDLDESEQWTAEVSAEYNGKIIMRRATPVFETKRATGERTIKTRVKTQLLIDDVEVNSDEWNATLGIDEKFLLTATPAFFFGLDWKKQREIINNVAINQDAALADFDLKDAAEKVSKLKTSQNQTKKKQDETQAVINSIKDIDAPELTAEEIELFDKSEQLKASDNSKAIAEINKQNNEAIEAHAKELARLNKAISESTAELEKLQKTEFEPQKLKIKKEVPTIEGKEIEILTLDAWKKAEFEKGFLNFPVVAENIKEINLLKSLNIDDELQNITPCCPLSGEICETATMQAKKAKETEIQSKISELSLSNKSILQKAYTDYELAASTHNKKIASAFSEKQEIENANSKIDAENLEIEKANVKGKTEFDENKSKAIAELEKQIQDTKEGLENLQQPEIKTLPETERLTLEESELLTAIKDKQKQISDAKAVNANNNVRLSEEKANLKQLQSEYAAAFKKTAEIQAEIDAYLEKLKECTKVCFNGDFVLDFEFYEQTLSGEYKETFRIFADGKEFMNTALQLKVGVQLIKGFAQAFGINPLIFIDNAECTSEINTYGMDAIELKFVENQSLKIK